MIINYLEINNFRQFVGNQRINFSTQSDKKVTILIAESGVGKTTLIQCFQWILYGECKYKTPINTEIKNGMQPHDKTKVECSLEVLHNNQIYNIRRYQNFFKPKTMVQADPSVLTVDIKKGDGISNQVRGRDAEKIVKELMPKDLFPYFFLEGESLTKVGQQMSKGKSGNQNEFAKAIKNLLGFNCLYEAQKHLAGVSSSYQEEIQKNTSDSKLKKIIEEMQKYDTIIQQCDERLETIDKEIDYNKQQKDLLNAKISKYADVEEKQKRTKTLRIELSDLLLKINDQKKYIFKKFSSNAFYKILNSLIESVNETMVNSDSIDKGIPGMNIEAINYLLNRHKCICGHEIQEGSAEWNELSKLLDLLPPNNIGFEIEKFKDDLKGVKNNCVSFDEDFAKARKDLNDFIRQYDTKAEELENLNEEIGSVNEDISSLKNQENQYYDKISELNIEKGKKLAAKSKAISDKQILQNEQEKFIVLDEKVKKLKLYYNESEYLRDRIARFCLKKENEKRIELENAINEIFEDFYEEKIKFILDDHYSVQIQTFDTELADDFTSGGQDVAVALAFIGAIIKLNREKDAETQELIDDDTNEEYPLVMDAPTSNFGMKQMKSFSEVMPKVTDQIIVFINDKDGPILKQQMSSQIGSEWALKKIDTYHTDIKEVIENGK